MKIRLCDILISLLLGMGLSSCHQDLENVSSGFNDYYYIERMRKLRLSPAYEGKSYRWTVQTSDGRDSLLSTDRDYVFLAEKKALTRLLSPSMMGSVDISIPSPYRWCMRIPSIVPIQLGYMSTGLHQGSLSIRCLFMNRAIMRRQCARKQKMT